MKLIEIIEKEGYIGLKNWLRSKKYQQKKFIKHDINYPYVTDEKMKYIKKLCKANNGHSGYKGLIIVENTIDACFLYHDNEGKPLNKNIYPFSSISEDYFTLESFSLFDKNSSYQDPIRPDVYTKYYYNINVISRENKVIELVLFISTSKRDIDGFGYDDQISYNLLNEEDTLKFLNSELKNDKVINTCVKNKELIDNLYSANSNKCFEQKEYKNTSTGTGLMSFYDKPYTVSLIPSLSTKSGVSIDYIKIVDEKFKKDEIAKYYTESKEKNQTESFNKGSDLGLY